MKYSYSTFCLVVSGLSIAVLSGVVPANGSINVTQHHNHDSRDGITGTPIVDLASRSLFLNAMTTPDGGTTKKHFIFSLNLDTGDINSGWPVDVGKTAVLNGTTFTPSVQAQRGALGIVDNILHVPYGSLIDCGIYHGWLVGVPIDNPATVVAWATSVIGGAIWGVGGVASDGTNPFVTTGNTFNTGGTWGRRRGSDSLPARPDLYRLAHRLLGACQLVGSR